MSHEPVHDANALCCHDSALQAGEPLYGTATRAGVWLMLEYAGPWGKTAFEGSVLPDEVKAHLVRITDTLPEARVQVIRQPTRSSHDIRFYVAITRETAPALFEFHLSQYEDILTLDVRAAAEGTPIYAHNRRDEPMYLVCTNGRRDPCCARRGPAVYEAVAADIGGAAWQSSHLGGHRFAAVAVCFPHGVCYGRLDPSSAVRMVQAQRAGQIYLEKYRGRVYHDAATQAADYWLRVQTGIADLEAFRLAGSPGWVGENVWAAQFVSSSVTGETGSQYEVRVEAVQADARRYTSCGDADPSEMVEYQFVSCETVPRARSGVIDYASL